MKYLCLVYLAEDKLHAVPDRICKTYGDGRDGAGCGGLTGGGADCD